MSQAATKEALELLHAELARVLTAALSEDNVSPVILSNARQFLRDNGIEAAADTHNEALQGLQTALTDAEIDNVIELATA